jgi:uncharacterized membrane-anchored protein
MMMPTVSEKGEQEHAKTVLDNRVPEISIAFWVIKILSTTTGETVSDYLNETVGLGLPNTTYITMSLLIVTMVAQLYSPRYNPYIYWLAVILYSIVGTAITDNLTDGLEVELWLSTVVFAVLLAVTFGVWYYKEKTLNFHTIFTRRREAFYWVAILFTFALGTAGGDLITEGLGWGYGVGVALFGGCSCVVLRQGQWCDLLLVGLHSDQAPRSIDWRFVLSRYVGGWSWPWHHRN